MTRRVRKRIQAGVAFEELLAEEFPTKEQRRAFQADVRAKLGAVLSMVPIDAAGTASALEDWTLAHAPEFVGSRAVADKRERARTDVRGGSVLPRPGASADAEKARP